MEVFSLVMLIDKCAGCVSRPYIRVMAPLDEPRRRGPAPSIVSQRTQYTRHAKRRQTEWRLLLGAGRDPTRKSFGLLPTRFLIRGVSYPYLIR